MDTSWPIRSNSHSTGPIHRKRGAINFYTSIISKTGLAVSKRKISFVPSKNIHLERSGYENLRYINNRIIHYNINITKIGVNSLPYSLDLPV
jgi:hypothetical protein